MAYYYFADTYGSGLYGSGTYERTAADQASAQATSAADDSSGGLLANTGFDVLLAVTIASAIIFAALLIRFWKQPSKPTEQ